MRYETRHAMEMLYHAKWNVPQAALASNLTVKECKIVFGEYARLHPPEPLTQQLVLQL